MHNTNKTIIVVSVFVILLALTLNPLGWWMSSILTNIIVGAILLVFALYSGLVFREHTRDEREEEHSARAGQVSYVATLWLLVIGISIQSIARDPDIFLVVILALSVITKLCARIYLDKYK